MPQLRFDGRVVVVTGAGGGLGRAYALFFGSRGAQVVVNDLGGSLQGNGASSRAADQVVEEIKRKGGQAVADYGSVENGSAIIATAIKIFGAIHILINNAGVIRDVSFSKMKDSDWELVLQVHLHGAYQVCSAAAWPYFRRQKFGRIINTTSGAGLYGNFGQANYSAAKLALVGLTQTLAKEGFGDNILVNAIAPIAASRMTATVMTPELLRQIDPHFVIPAVAVLVHSSNHVETGGIFEVGGGSVRKLRWERSLGVTSLPDAVISPAQLIKSWSEVTSFTSSAEHPTVPQFNDQIGFSLATCPRRTDAPAASFQGQVALITGAATKSGRAYASVLARLGASIIAFDDIRDPSETVDSIRSTGGHAIACRDVSSLGSVINGLGRLDIVITTSDVPDGQSFDKTSYDTWRRIIEPSLNQTYKIVKIAWAFFLKENKGRIVIGISPMGIFGQPGQSAYASAMLGALGLTRTLALEGKRKNVRANAVACHSNDALSAASALIAALCDDELPEPASGGLYEVGRGRVASIRWQATGGWVFGSHQPLLPEQVLEKLPVIVDFEDGRTEHPSTTQDSTDHVFGSPKKARTGTAATKL